MARQILEHVYNLYDRTSCDSVVDIMAAIEVEQNNVREAMFDSMVSARRFLNAI